MSLFQTPPPPQPTQGAFSSTPPWPPAPIGTQGTAPPLRQVGGVLAMCAVLASWPADLEPVLQRPNNTHQQIAPLTLPSGSQPRPVAFVSAPNLSTIVAAWPLDYPPRQASPLSAVTIPPPPIPIIQPYNPFRYDVLASTLDTYEVEVVPTAVVAQSSTGQPPGQNPFGAVTLGIVLQAWTPDAPLIWRVASNAVASVPGASAPAPSPFLSASMLGQIVAAWGAEVGPLEPGPALLAPHVAPLTLTYGSAPPLRPFLAPALLTQIVSAWPTDTGPLAPWPLDTTPHIAPQTLPTGTPPPTAAFLSPTQLRQIVETWQVDWAAQAAPRNAWINAAPNLTVIPYAPLPKHLWTAQEPPWQAPPRPVMEAPLTLSYGMPPVPRAALAVTTLTQIVSAWSVDWPAQTYKKNAAVNPPPSFVVIPYRRLHPAILLANEVVWWAPPRPVTVYAATLKRLFQPQWALGSNVIAGPIAPQPETH